MLTDYLNLLFDEFVELHGDKFYGDDRALRTGFPEVIFGLGKTPEQIIAIARSLYDRSQNVLVTRLDAEKARAQAHLGRINRPDAL